jgi:cyclophilin family peptidyl-prolyl cis-trans isomerase
MKVQPLILIAIIFVLVLPIGAYVLTNGTSNTPTTSSSSPTPTPNSSSMPDPADAISAHKVILKTSKGDIAINLVPDDAPMTVKNFVTLGKRGYYNNVTFHRVIKDFMIQAGDPAGTGSGGESIYGPTFKDEINSHKIVKGSVAMANRGPNTNSSQFFIVTETSQPSLDGSYTYFGQVADDASQAVVQAIAAVPTDANDKPTEKVSITGFQIVE